MLRNFFALVLLSFTVGSLAGCALIGKKLESPKIRVQEVQVEKVEAGRVWLNLVLAVQNPNQADFTVDQLEYSLDVSSRNVIAESYNKKIKIEANKVTVASIPLQVKLEDIISSALTLLTNKTLPYRASGRVQVGPFKIPFNETGQLDISDL